jgi:hypothetical protein
MRRTERFVALLAAIALPAASAPPEGRHVVTGHFKPPHSFRSRLASAPGNVVTNGGFETGKIDAGWHQCSDLAASVGKEHPYAGSYDEYSGTLSGKGEPAGNIGVCQQIRVPAGGVLTAQLYQLSDEADATYAYQEADLLDGHGNVVVNLYRSANNTAAWVRGTWNLAAYAGRTFWLYFGVHGDGYAKRSTQQFVDEVILAPSRE